MAGLSEGYGADPTFLRIATSTAGDPRTASARFNVSRAARRRAGRRSAGGRRQPADAFDPRGGTRRPGPARPPRSPASRSRSTGHADRGRLERDSLVLDRAVVAVPLAGGRPGLGAGPPGAVADGPHGLATGTAASCRCRRPTRSARRRPAPGSAGGRGTPSTRPATTACGGVLLRRRTRRGPSWPSPTVPRWLPSSAPSARTSTWSRRGAADRLGDGGVDPRRLLLRAHRPVARRRGAPPAAGRTPGPGRRVHRRGVRRDDGRRDPQRTAGRPRSLGDGPSVALATTSSTSSRKTGFQCSRSKTSDACPPGDSRTIAPGIRAPAAAAARSGSPCRAR